MTLRWIHLYLICCCISHSPLFASEIYKWISPDGKHHYSDRAPKYIASTDISSSLLSRIYIPKKYVDDGTTANSIKIDIKSNHSDISHEIRDEITNNINRIFTQQKKLFISPNKNPIAINILIFSDEKEFRTNQTIATGAALKSPGYYSIDQNVAGILAQRDLQQTLRIIYHEASHAISHGLVDGPLPNWIDEGLSEYFESADFLVHDSIAIRLPINRKSLYAINRGNETEILSTLFSRNNNHWRSAGDSEKNAYYNQAWATISFLLSSKTGENLLIELINKSSSRTRNFSSENFIDAQFEGGITTFSQQWRRWVAQNTVE